MLGLGSSFVLPQYALFLAGCKEAKDSSFGFKRDNEGFSLFDIPATSQWNFMQSPVLLFPVRIATDRENSADFRPFPACNLRAKLQYG